MVAIMSDWCNYPCRFLSPTACADGNCRHGVCEMVTTIGGDSEGRICTVYSRPSTSLATTMASGEETVVDTGSHESGIAVTILLFCVAIAGGVLLTTGLANLIANRMKGGRR